MMRYTNGACIIVVGSLGFAPHPNGDVTRTTPLFFLFLG